MNERECSGMRRRRRRVCCCCWCYLLERGSRRSGRGNRTRRKGWCRVWRRGGWRHLQWKEDGLVISVGIGGCGLGMGTCVMFWRSRRHWVGFHFYNGTTTQHSAMSNKQSNSNIDRSSQYMWLHTFEGGDVNNMHASYFYKFLNGTKIIYISSLVVGIRVQINPKTCFSYCPPHPQMSGSVGGSFLSCQDGQIWMS